jgi:uncharacterized protein YecE (DUF72 family)
LGEVYLGTSGWSYKEWVKVFYPSDETKKLSFYSKYFMTAEIDSTFYAYPNKGLVFGWAKNTPDGFLFSAKLPKLVTHDKRLDLEKGVKADTMKFLDLMNPVIKAGKLGPILIQLPPSFSKEEDFGALGKFFEVLPTDLTFAVEFRHPSWVVGETWDLLRKYNVVNTIVDEPLLPPDVVVTSDTAFIRWHGRGRQPWYNYRYSGKELKTWVPKVKVVVSKTKKVFGYFNNHFHGFAIENSLQMMKMAGEMNKDQEKLLSDVTARINKERNPSTEGNLQEFLGHVSSKTS